MQKFRASGGRGLDPPDPPVRLMLTSNLKYLSDTLVAMPVYGAPGAGQCAVRRAAAATSPRAPGFRYIRPRWVEAARAAAAGRGRKMVPSVLLPAFAAPRRTGGAPVREAAQVAGRCAPAG